MFGQDTLRMELDAPDGKLPVSEAHDLAFLGLRRDLKAFGDGIAPDDQGVIASGRERVWEALEKILFVVPDG